MMTYDAFSEEQKLKPPLPPEFYISLPKKTMSLNLGGKSDINEFIIMVNQFIAQLPQQVPISFPLCSRCLHLYLTDLKNYTKYVIKYTNEFVDLIDPTQNTLPLFLIDLKRNYGIQSNCQLAHTIGIDNIESSNSKIKNSPSNFSDRSATHPDIIQQVKSKKFKSSLLLHYPQDYAFDSCLCYDPFSCTNPNHRHITSIPEAEHSYSIISCTTFHIGYFHHYGVINGCRIGFYCYDVNTINECNRGLNFLHHLLLYLSSCFDINAEKILAPNSIVFVENSEPVLFEVPQYNERNLISLFNLALDRVFYLVCKIIRSKNCFSICSYPPYTITVRKHKISGIVYHYSPRHLTEWSDAMRYLLVDLKFIQYRALRAFFNPTVTLTENDFD